MSDNETNQFDVIILGSGIGGSTLATILAKHQARVLMIDKATHPRFTIGEATTSYTDTLLLMLAHQYSIPEFEHLSSFQNICENTSLSTCGYKRNFGFLYHHEEQEQFPQERIQWGTGHDIHLFRQDVDHYIVQVASNYGAKLLAPANIVDIDINEQAVKVKIDNGEEFYANYLVDASGYKSPLAQKLNLREKPTRLKTHSRSIFTHMVGVKNTDDCIKSNGKKENLVPWYQGTLHHIFDGGWMWVIPFNNHEKSTNPICSVGVNFDSRRYPRNEALPEQEFQNFLSRYPSIAIQFQNAKPIRNWVSTERLQYSSHSCVGERFYVLPHAAGFIDAIFSSGLILTFTTISPLAALILKSIATNDFSKQNFTALARLQQKLLDYNDNIANCLYISTQKFNLLDAVLRVWLLQHLMITLKLKLSYVLGFCVEDFHGYTTKDLKNYTEIEYLQDLDGEIERWGNGYVKKAVAEVEKVEKGLISPDKAASNIRSLINSTSWLFKLTGLGDNSIRFVDVLTSRRIIFSFLAYIFWARIFLKKDSRPFDFTYNDFVNAIRLGIDI
jgi:FADH2 O2-dependent halogenase